MFLKLPFDRCVDFYEALWPVFGSLWFWIKVIVNCGGV